MGAIIYLNNDIFWCSLIVAVDLFLWVQIYFYGCTFLDLYVFCALDLYMVCAA